MITALIGNSFLVHQELERRKQEYLAKYNSMGLVCLDGYDDNYERFCEALESTSLLSEKQLVVLRNPSNNKEFAAHLDSLLTRVLDDTDVIIVEDKIDKRQAYYKMLKKSTDLMEFQDIEENDLDEWLASTVRQAAGTISLADARYLVDRVGANQQRLSQEITKLLQYNTTINQTSIDLLTEPTPQSTIFQLLDAAFAGNTKRAIMLYDEQRRQKVEAPRIIAMISWQLHLLALVKNAGQRSLSKIAKDANVKTFAVNKSAPITARINKQFLQKLIRRTAEIDIALKTTALDADDAIKQLLIDIGSEAK